MVCKSCPISKSEAWGPEAIYHSALGRHFADLSLWLWPFIPSLVADFFLFMEHLYLDVLPSPKSKHGGERNSLSLLSPSILLPLLPGLSLDFTSYFQPPPSPSQYCFCRLLCRDSLFRISILAFLTWSKQHQASLCRCPFWPSLCSYLFVDTIKTQNIFYSNAIWGERQIHFLSLL